jgi:UDP-MurNAc hydroxylase
VRVRYIYSACVVIETPDVRVLCDPWFTPGAYDGAWYQWPVVEDPIGTIGPVELVYVSHIHPDHYDPAFLRAYLDRYPEARLIIGRQDPPIFQTKVDHDGFKFEVVSELVVGETKLSIFPNKAQRLNIDTALVVARGDEAVINLNDNPFDAGQLEAIGRATEGLRTVALLPYAGATVHPQCYLFDTPEQLDAAGKAKQRHFLDLFHKYIEALRPTRVVPFAGQYWLGGPLSALNPHRGIPDAVTAAAEAPQAVVLADGGHAFIDLDTMTASDVRSEPYDLAEVDRYLASAPFDGYAYQQELRPIGARALPLNPLVSTALRNARKRWPITDPCWICLQPLGRDRFICFEPTTSDDVVFIDGLKLPEDFHPRIEIYIDETYLFGLLTRLYHWDNAMLGAHYTYRREPDVYRRDVFNFLNFLCV